MPPPTHTLRDPDLLRARALMMVERRLKGSSYADIAKEFNVSENTVMTELKRAKQLELLAGFEDQIVDELMPAAIAAYKKAMEEGNTTVATEVFKGLGFLLRPSERIEQPSKDDDSSLEVYVRKFKGLHANRPVVTALPPATTDSIVEGSILEGATAGAEETTPRVGPDGGEGRFTDLESALAIPDDLD